MTKKVGRAAMGLSMMLGLGVVLFGAAKCFFASPAGMIVVSALVLFLSWCLCRAASAGRENRE